MILCLGMNVKWKKNKLNPTGPNPPNYFPGGRHEFLPSVDSLTAKAEGPRTGFPFVVMPSPRPYILTYTLGKSSALLVESSVYTVVCMPSFRNDFGKYVPSIFGFWSLILSSWEANSIHSWGLRFALDSDWIASSQNISHWCVFQFPVCLWSFMKTSGGHAYTLVNYFILF